MNKVNKFLNITYKVKCDKPYELQKDMFTSLVKAHWRYLKDSGGHMPGDGRVVLGIKGVVEYETPQDS